MAKLQIQGSTKVGTRAIHSLPSSTCKRRGTRRQKVSSPPQSPADKICRPLVSSLVIDPLHPPIKRNIRRELFPIHGAARPIAHTSHLDWIQKQQKEIFDQFCDRYNLDAEGLPVPPQ
eukprot:TRINITY_DN6550_c0_g1_i1.p2 TRINITY_DN6550_c0_g1~~TRINITY_DN6550_c0_g1_i1.p2  ORF type:complete len:118 (+),score=4.67 TRINITY_DN6550_c0_g1_i1:291-644(+)